MAYVESWVLIFLPSIYFINIEGWQDEWVHKAPRILSDIQSINLGHLHCQIKLIYSSFVLKL